MSIAVVAHSNAPGGAERYLVELYRNASRPVLFGHLRGWQEADLVSRQVEFGPKWNRTSILNGVARLPAERSRLLAAVADADFDYFHLQFKREQIGFSRALSARAPVVWTEHGRFIGGLNGALLGRAYRRASRYVRGVLCVSETVAESVARVVRPSVAIEVIENGIDLAGFQPASLPAKIAAKRVLGVPGGARVAAWVGQLHDGKAPEKIISIAENFEGVVVVAGDGPLRGELQRDSTHLDNIKWLGHVNDVRTVLAAADVFLFTSKNRGEGYPTTSMLEAGASGLPTITDAASGAGRVAQLSGGSVIQGRDWGPSIDRIVGSEVASHRARAWAEGHSLTAWRRSHEQSLTRILDRKIDLGAG